MGKVYKDSLGDRMKGYENISRVYLMKKVPVIIRLDGRSFHTFTNGFKRPFDDILMTTMQEVAKALCEEIIGCKLAYTQSDEISLLLTDYDTYRTQAWFDNNLQKLVSISASMATLAFNRIFERKVDREIKLGNIDESYVQTLTKATKAGATFDSRAFIMPKDEVCNYFIWRQQDATRNSIQMLAQSLFSFKELLGKSCSDLQDMMMLQKGVNWNDCTVAQKRGSCVVKDTDCAKGGWVVDTNIPIFTQERDYVERLVFLANDENE